MIGTSSHNYSGMQCPCCQMAGTLARHHERKDINSRQIEIAMCLYCSALVDITSLQAAIELGHNTEVQRDSSEQFYQVTEDAIANVDERVRSVGSIIDFALAHLPENFPRRAFADFGAGMGYMAGAGAERFEISYAIEFNTVALEQLRPHFAQPEKIRISQDIAKVGGEIDLISIWHTIEHMPDAQSMLRLIRSKLSPSGAMIFQCPMFNPEYVVYSHYFFLNEFACRTMCERAGFGDVQVWFDTDADFVTCLAINNRPAAETPVSRHEFSAAASAEERARLSTELAQSVEQRARLSDELVQTAGDILISRQAVKGVLQRVTRPMRGARRVMRRAWRGFSG